MHEEKCDKKIQKFHKKIAKKKLSLTISKFAFSL